MIAVAHMLSHQKPSHSAWDFQLSQFISVLRCIHVMCKCVLFRWMDIGHSITESPIRQFTHMLWSASSPKDDCNFQETDRRRRHSLLISFLYTLCVGGRAVVSVCVYLCMIRYQFASLSNFHHFHRFHPSTHTPTRSLFSLIALLFIVCA